MQCPHKQEIIPCKNLNSQYPERCVIRSHKVETDNRLGAAKRGNLVNEYQVYNITRDREINIYDYFSLGWYFRPPFLIKLFIKTVNLCPEI